MKRFGFIILLCLLVFIGAEDSVAKKDKGSKKEKSTTSKSHKVTICHKGKTITIAESALKAHLNHGDTKGKCPAPPPKREETVTTSYIYRYYSRAGVYYDVTRKLYFFLRHGQWEQSETLPTSITLDTEEDAIELEFDSDTPYVYHADVLKQYPAPPEQYQYLYYPDAQVYYDERREIYFYSQEGEWEMSFDLPESISIDRANGVSLSFDTKKPYLHHEEVLQKYSISREERREVTQKNSSSQTIVASFSYRYFPAVEVYFDVSRELYFYLSEENTWQSGSSLPEWLAISQEERQESVELTFESETPYLHHDEVLEQYPSSRVAICHKGKKTLWLPESAIKAHLGHGDTLGECGDNGKKGKKK